MRTIIFTDPMYLRASGDIVVSTPEGPCNVREGTAEWDMVQAYLLAHPEAVQPEPAPPVPTQEELIRRELAEKLAYLQSTDWYVVRYAETGTAIPEDVIAARAAARTRIDELRA